VPVGTRPSLRPLGLKRVERPSIARAKHAARLRVHVIIEYLNIDDAGSDS
jgi:hypothetical protein